MNFVHVLTMDSNTPDQVTYVFNCRLITSIVVENNVCTVTMGSDVQRIKFADNAQAEDLRLSLINGIKSC